MGGMKELLFDIEAERFDEWLEENHPDVVPGSKEWEHAANLYYWEQEALADQAQWDHEHGLFVASLNWYTECLSSMPSRLWRHI